ncbi:MAG: hypothetical protein DSM107014_09860 [Gomphosphaeria aponina SAG 52.96 = DSM 107014]|uniref:Uncharacterized protein n=1 Tax=Gomphosphaeria aponina SAG 52.96 = DSM 107014 TaxID=1521640 RepID=A0A941GQV7_9CHRO|nr:hypothetical protein [Gomphosphaeria aponina SAG 52.96 = DSM 107014]
MNKPTVTVKGKKYFVGQVSVVLKLNSGPLIYLKLSEKLDGTEYNLSNEESFKKEFFQDIGQEEEGNFQWNGITIKFILVGYNSSEARTFELVGLVVKKELTDWFNENNFKSKPQDYFIYQKHKGKDSWIFFNKVLGDKFKQPPQDFLEKTKLLFPDNACIWRYKDSNNFHFLNRAIAFASRHLPEVQGWGAFDSDKPLRLILFEEQKQDQSIPKLDETWNPSYPFLPNRYSWNRWLDSSFTLSRDLSINEGQEMALIKELVTDGDNGENPQKGQNFQGQNPTRLLYVPDTINLGKKNLLCKAITYEFKLPGFGEELPSITMKLDIEYPERQIGDNEIVSLGLSGKFQAWEEEKEEETKVKIAPSDDEKWGIIDEQDQTVKSGADAVLYTHILSRTYSDKKFSGIYIKHEKDDEMILEVHACDIPLVLGSLQKYHQKLEEADVTFSGKKLAISISPHSQKIDDSEAIILEKSQIKLNHGKQIFGQALNKVDFLSQTVEIGSTQVNINSGQTKINSLVNVSFPSPKMSKPIVPSIPTGVMGVADEVITHSDPVVAAPSETISSSMSEELESLRQKYNLLSPAKTIGVAKTDIPGLEDEIFEGLSPQQRKEAKLPSLDEIMPNREIKSPSKNPAFTRHAEEDILNQVHEKIKLQGLTDQDLDGKTLFIHIDNDRGLCELCAVGLRDTGNNKIGVVKQFSDLYPTLKIQITAQDGVALRRSPEKGGKIKVLVVKGGKIQE